MPGPQTDRTKLEGIQWISLDCANTLLSVNWKIDEFALRCAQDAQLAVPPDAGKLYAKMYMQRLPDFLKANLSRDDQQGDAHYHQLGLDWLKELDLDPSWQPKLRAAADHLLYSKESDLFKVFPETIQALEALKTHNFRLIVISNWDYTLDRILRAHGLSGFFAHTFASLVEGVEKPDPRLFEIALAKAGARRKAVVHVGDDPVDDIQGAQNSGIHSILVDRTQPPDPPSRIQNLTQLLECITHG